MVANNKVEQNSDEKVKSTKAPGRGRKAASAAPAGSEKPEVSTNAINMLSDRVLLQVPRGDGERTSRAGILIPATAQIARRLTWAEVVSVGPLVRSVSALDQALFHKDDAYEVEIRGDDYMILRERDIHAVASPRDDGEGTGLYL